MGRRRGKLFGSCRILIKNGARVDRDLEQLWRGSFSIFVFPIQMIICEIMDLSYPAKAGVISSLRRNPSETGNG